MGWDTLERQLIVLLSYLLVKVLGRYKQSIQKVKGKKKKNKIYLKNTDKVLVHTAVCSEMLLTRLFLRI